MEIILDRPHPPAGSLHRVRGGWGESTRGGSRPGLRWTHAEGPTGNHLRNICKGAEEE